MKNFIKIIFLVLSLILFLAPTVLSATAHEFRTTVDAAGAYRINTVPEKIWDDPAFQMALNMGLPGLVATRDDYVWDDKPLTIGHHSDLESNIDRLKVFTHFLDTHLVGELITVVYYPHMNDAIIYLHKFSKGFHN